MDENKIVIAESSLKLFKLFWQRLSHLERTLRNWGGGAGNCQPQATCVFILISSNFVFSHITCQHQ